MIEFNKKLCAAFMFIFFSVFSNVSVAQYHPFYESDRNLKSFSHYDVYLNIIGKYNIDKNIDSTIGSLDSLASLTLIQNDFLQYLFIKNEVSNFYKFDNRFNEGYSDLYAAMQFFSSKMDTVVLEYMVSLRMLRGLLTRSKQTSRGEEEMLLSQLAILDSLGIEGEPLTNTLVDYGLFLNRKGEKDTAIELLYRARTTALQNNDYMSFAVADYALITGVSDYYDLQETVLEVIKNDIEILETRPPSIPMLTYQSYFNYLLADKYYFYNNDIESTIRYCEKALACLDSINYPVWNLRASIHSILAYCYSNLNNLPKFWNSFNESKLIADTKPMSAYNKSLAYIHIADAVLSISVDSTLMLIDSIRNQPGQIYFSDMLVEIEAKALMNRGEYSLAIDILSNIFENHEVLSGKLVPIVSDSIPLHNQLKLLSLLTNCYKRVDKASGQQNNVGVIVNLISKQNQVFINFIQSNIFGFEPSSIIREYKQFLVPNLQYLIDNDTKRALQDEIVRLFFSSKAILLNANLGKLASQSLIEADETQFAKIIEVNSKIQDIKNIVGRVNLPDNEKKQLNLTLNNYLVENLMLKYWHGKDLKAEKKTIVIPSLDAIQSKLAKTEGIFELSVDDSTLVTLLIKKDTVIYSYKSIENFGKLISGELYSIKTGGKLSKEFSAHILNGVEQEMAKLEKLVVVADGALLQLPFEMLVLPETGKKIIEELIVAYSYSTALWYLNEPTPQSISKKQILAVAPLFYDNDNQVDNLVVNSQYRGSDALAPLYFSEVEVQTIAKTYSGSGLGVRTLVGKEANKSTLFEEISNYDIIHFATHGRVNKKHYERSGLYLHPESIQDTISIQPDNFLSLGELYNMRLNANLVVLSACHSGLGTIYEGEGTIALPRGFIYAGVPNVIVSLWRVNDEKTKDLMVAFYDNLLKGYSYAESLHLAKLSCIKKGFLPLDWAGFVLIGS